MIKKLTAYILAGCGFIGIGYFKNYDGNAISHSTLWLILSIAIGLLGLYMIYFRKSNKLTEQELYNKMRLDLLKNDGEEILLKVDNCEIRENNYYQEVVNDTSSRIQKIDALYDPNKNYRQEYIEQSAVIYYYTTGETKHKMTSQSFSFDANTLTNYINNKKVILYVSRLDKKDYVFELAN